MWSAASLKITDSEAPSGVWVRYRIVATVGDFTTEAVTTPVVLPVDVSDFGITEDDRRLTLNWRTPPAAEAVEIWRSLAGDDEAALVFKGQSDRFEDREVVNDQTYSYRIAALFSSAPSAGVSKTATPFEHPVSAGPLTWKQTGARAAFHWSPPSKGRAFLLIADRPSQSGLQVAAERSSLGDCLNEQAPGFLELTFPKSGVWQVALCVERSGRILVDPAKEIAWVDTVKNLKGLRYSNGAPAISWQWGKWNKRCCHRHSK